MERWFISFFLGLLLSLFLPQIPELLYLLCLLMSCACVLFFALKSYFTGLLCGICLILVNAYVHYSWDVNNHLNRQTIHQQPVLVKGQVRSLINEGEQQIRFDLQLSHFNNQLLSSRFNVRLSWQKATLKIKQGDIVQLFVKVKPAHGLANIGGFSYKKWLLQKRISVTGYITKSAKNRIVKHNMSVRQQLFDRLNLHLNSEYKGLIMALALGDKSLISAEQWLVLQQTGTAHLMAISGLHLGLIAGFALVLMRLAVYCIPNSMLCSQNMVFMPIAFSILLACCYAYLAGFSLPTIRALVMLIVFWVIKFSSGKVSLIRWLLLTLFFILLIEPFAILDSSLYLSLVAVSAILFVMWRFNHLLQGRSKLATFFYSLLLVQLSLTFLLMPITALLFNQISALSFVANIVVVPLLSVTAIPLTLFATIVFFFSQSFAQYLYWLVEQSLAATWWYLDLLMQFSGFVVRPNQLVFSVLIIACLMALLVACHLIKTKQAMLIATYMCAVLGGINYVIKYTNEQQNKWQMTVFDVGHGLSVMIEKNNKAILYDTGAVYPSGFSMVKSVVEPYMYSRFISQFDQVILSHKDNDHSGGLKYLKQNQLAKSYRYNFSPKLSQPRLASTLTCQQGHEFMWQGLQFKMLWPIKVLGDKNDQSCVIEIFDGEHRVLLPGDISENIERILIKQKKIAPVDVLIAPHHGSKTSSSKAFVSVINARYVVFSSGYLNRWQMPVEEVQNRFKNANSIAVNTSKSGMIQFGFAKGKSDLNTFNDNLMPYWPWIN